MLNKQTDALNNIAKTTHDKNYWYSITIEINSIYVLCNICGKKIASSTASDTHDTFNMWEDMKEHGLHHYEKLKVFL